MINEGNDYSSKGYAYMIYLDGVSYYLNVNNQWFEGDVSGAWVSNNFAGYHPMPPPTHYALATYLPGECKLINGEWIKYPLPPSESATKEFLEAAENGSSISITTIPSRYHPAPEPDLAVYPASQDSKDPSLQSNDGKDE